MRNKTDYSNSNYRHSCTLVVPGLLKCLSEDYGDYCADNVQLNELRLFLAKAKQKKIGYTGFEKVLFELFNQTAELGQPHPVAPVCYLADAETVDFSNRIPTGWCLRADPVQLIPDRDELVLYSPEELSLSMYEAEQLVSELNVLFEEDGWLLEAKTATRWYLHLSEDPLIITSDLSEVRGESIGKFLPAGPHSTQWHRIMNEVQMVLHSSKVNSERTKHDQQPVSSLWFWGGGKLPELNHSNWSQVWSDEVLSRGLAKVTRTPCFPITENSKTWLSQVNTPGEHLIIYEDFILLSENDPDAQCRILKEFESKWVIPLLEALRNGDLDQITVNPCDGRTFILTKNRLKHWWRRLKPLHSYCR